MDEKIASSAKLIMVMGLPGSGKTYFAKALAQEMAALHFNSDRIRKELDSRPGYSSKEKGHIYQVMYDRVCEGLLQGMSVIVDATFSKAVYRTPYLNWTVEHKIPTCMIMLEASERVIRTRVSKKRPDSDADFEVYRSIKDQYEPLTEDHLLLQSDEDSLQLMIRKALDYMKKRNEEA